MTRIRCPKLIEATKKRKEALIRAIRNRQVWAFDTRYVDLCGAELSGCNLDGLDFSYSYLISANLSNCSVVGTKFEGSWLHGVLWGNTNIHQNKSLMENETFMRPVYR